MSAPQPPTPVRPSMPPSPRLFLVDGYALIYRAFFALIARPLTTSRGENTSAAWGVVNFLQRLVETHRPDYLGWVLDSGMSFRHERYPAYKATREKLTEELQSDFDRGMERIRAVLDAYRIPILSLQGYEADDVIGTLAQQSVEKGVSAVLVSGDKDFQQLVRPGVWVLNPGRGGAAAVEEQWVGVENGSERLGVPPERVTDFLALVGDSSDNVPGVKGIGEKTAQELVSAYGSLDDILAHAAELTKKRPREALLEHGGLALLSKELVTIRVDLPIALDLDALRLATPDYSRLRSLYVELEFHTLARNLPVGEDVPAPEEEVPARRGGARYLHHDRLGRGTRPGDRTRAERAVRFGRCRGSRGPASTADERSAQDGARGLVDRDRARRGVLFPAGPSRPRPRRRSTSGSRFRRSVGRRRRWWAWQTRACPQGRRADEHRRAGVGAGSSAAVVPSLARQRRARPAARVPRGPRGQQDCARREVRDPAPAPSRSHAARARLRHNGRELRARPWSPVPRARSAGARVPRPENDFVRGTLRQGEGSDPVR